MTQHGENRELNKNGNWQVFDIYDIFGNTKSYTKKLELHVYILAYILKSKLP